MCVCSTAKRRRRQAKNNYNHLAPKQRPNFKMRSAEVASARDERKWKAQQERRARGAKH